MKVMVRWKALLKLDQNCDGDAVLQLSKLTGLTGEGSGFQDPRTPPSTGAATRPVTPRQATCSSVARRSSLRPRPVETTGGAATASSPIWTGRGTTRSASGATPPTRAPRPTRGPPTGSRTSSTASSRRARSPPGNTEPGGRPRTARRTSPSSWTSRPSST